jgi:hypothetical protein
LLSPGIASSLVTERFNQPVDKSDIDIAGLYEFVAELLAFVPIVAMIKHSIIKLVVFKLLMHMDVLIFIKTNEQLFIRD